MKKAIIEYKTNESKVQPPPKQKLYKLICPIKYINVIAMEYARPSGASVIWPWARLISLFKSVKWTLGIMLMCNRKRSK